MVGKKQKKGTLRLNKKEFLFVEGLMERNTPCTREAILIFI